MQAARMMSEALREQSKRLATRNETTLTNGKVVCRGLHITL